MNALHRPAAMLLVAALLGACAGASATAPPTPTPGIDATHMPAPTAPPTPSQPEVSAPPSPTAPSWTVPMAVDGLARVVTDDLVVRSAPGTAPDSIIDPVRAPRDFLVFILDGPVAADGYDWYKVVTFAPYIQDDVGWTPTPGMGWLAAAGRDGEPWIAPWEGLCSLLTVDQFMYTPRLQSLACFGGRPFALEGEWGQCDSAVDLGVPTAWLQSGGCQIQPVGFDPGLIAPPWLRHSSPGLKIPVGTLVRVTVHLDDPAARDCESSPYYSYDPLPHDVVELYCRLEVVMTDIEVLAE